MQDTQYVLAVIPSYPGEFVKELAAFPPPRRSITFANRLFEFSPCCHAQSPHHLSRHPRSAVLTLGSSLREATGTNPVTKIVSQCEEKDKGRVSPYGVYDIAANEGWVNVGVDHDTAAFAVESIRRWWNKLGKKRYADKARRLLITADCGGSNGARVRLWKVELQKLANETGLSITVAHHPPGTSKWNRIEHRLFSFISINWRGRPLLSHQVIVQLIASTKTKTGLNVACDIDWGHYPKDITVKKSVLENLHIRYDDFHGDWNYTISPQPKP